MKSLAHGFQFVAEGYEGATPAISCDGLVPGAGLDLSHWQGNRTPRRYKADTSTEIALNFIADPEAFTQWAGALAVNNHFDTDGALSAWVLLEPGRASECRDLLVAAAEAGDFDEWPALEQGLWLDAAIRALAAGAPPKPRPTTWSCRRFSAWFVTSPIAAICGGASGTISKRRPRRSSRAACATAPRFPGDRHSSARLPGSARPTLGPQVSSRRATLSAGLRARRRQLRLPLRTSALRMGRDCRSPRACCA